MRRAKHNIPSSTKATGNFLVARKLLGTSLVRRQAAASSFITAWIWQLLVWCRLPQIFSYQQT